MVTAKCPVLPLVRMGRGKMMGVDHNKDFRGRRVGGADRSPG
jgi:hypothetical protein